jgi:hypothetical protein
VLDVFGQLFHTRFLVCIHGICVCNIDGIYTYIIMMGYIEYRIDNFGLQKHLPESVKKPIHRIKASSGIEKKTYT